jgi:hypothetical protein
VGALLWCRTAFYIYLNNNHINYVQCSMGLSMFVYNHLIILSTCRSPSRVIIKSAKQLSNYFYSSWIAMSVCIGFFVVVVFGHESLHLPVSGKHLKEYHLLEINSLFSIIKLTIYWNKLRRDRKKSRTIEIQFKKRNFSRITQCSK